MKKFLTAVALLLVIFGVLAVKIYFDLIGQPQYYLKQIGTAITTHNLVDFEKWVDLSGVADGIITDYFAGLARQPEPTAIATLKNELRQALTEQIREYVKTGQLKKVALSDCSKPARVILAPILLTGDAMGQFQNLAYVKEAGQTATVGLKSNAEIGGSIVMEVKLRRVDSQWRVVRINNFEEIKTRLHRREKQKNIKIEDLLIQGVKNSVIWGKFDREEVFLELSNSTTPTWPNSLAINLDETECLCFTLIGGAAKIPLRFDPDQAMAFEEDGRLNSHYYVQASEYDFDGDGQAELVIAIGDNNIDLVVNVFKYSPSNQENSGEMKPENWVLAGKFMGQDKAYINGHNIRLPYTAVKIEVEYRWAKGGFQEVR